MPSVPIAVSISDVLEVRGGPLRESEVWALLCQSAAAIQDFFIKGASIHKEDGTTFVISPATLTVGRDGQVAFAPGPSTWHGTDFTAPEASSDLAHNLSDTAIEKMFLYTLGKTLQVATEFGLRRNEYVGISQHLDSLLDTMCEENPAVRVGLRPILEACDLHTRQHPGKMPYAQTITRLYLSVLGSTEQHAMETTYSSDTSRQSTLALRSRRRPRQHHHQRHPRHSSASSQSPSPTRSRSRSRSRSRGVADSGFYTHPADKAENHSATAVTAATTAMPDTTATSDGIPVTSSSRTAATSPPPSSLVTAAATGNITSTSTLNSRAPSRGPMSTQDLLNASFASSMDDHPLYRTVPAYRAMTPMPGLLGLRMGSPAYEKYVQLKERQRRLKAAQRGEQAEERDGRMSVPPHYTPQASGMMDYYTDARSMASLMSYTLGSYLPELHGQPGSEAALHSNRYDEHDQNSLLSSELSFLLQDTSFASHNVPSQIHSPHEEMAHSPSNNTVRLKRCLEEEPTDALPQPEEHEQHEQQPQQQETHQQQQQHQEPALQHLKQFGSRLDLTPTPDAPPPREFYGPEFVYRASRPVIRISLPLQGESLKNPALARRVIVVHLTGQKFEAIVDPCMTGRQLFDAVVPHTALDDFYFFGLTYICEGEHFFVDADVKLHKMAPEGWREGAKGHMPPVTFTLYLRIKFYPDSLADFRHTSSQHLLYLQLRRDILEERCMATDEQLLALSGLALHAEFGDYKRRTMGQNYFVPEQYLPARVARRLGMAYVQDKALEAHRNALGLAPSQCEIQFIKMVQGLPEYGIHFYKLMKNKNDMNNIMWIGITQASMLIAEASGAHRTVTRRLPWPAIMKISFNKRRFSVQPKVDPATHAKGKPPKLNFFTNSYRKGRYLLQLSTAQHRFHIRMRTRAAALETLGGDGVSGIEELHMADYAPAHEAMGYREDGEEEHTLHEEREEEEEEEREKDTGLEEEDGEADVKSDLSKQKQTSSASESTSPEPLIQKSDGPPLKYRSPPPYRPNLDFMMEDMYGTSLNPNLDIQNWLSTTMDSDMHAVPESEATAMHGNGTHAPQVHDDVASPAHNPLTSQQHINHLSVPSSHHIHPSQLAHLPSGESSLGRHVFQVTLQKEGDKGIGVTIVGGETTCNLDLGIFVKSVMKDGPACKDGRILPGDRLIAINGVSLEGVQHHEAVKLIRDSEETVTLLVSQMRAPATIRRKNLENVKNSKDLADDDDAVCHSDDDGDADFEAVLPESSPSILHSSPYDMQEPGAAISHHSPHRSQPGDIHPHHGHSHQNYNGHSGVKEQFIAEVSAQNHSERPKFSLTVDMSPVTLSESRLCRDSDSVTGDLSRQCRDSDSAAGDELSLAEDLLMAAELDSHTVSSYGGSYGSTDIDRALEAEGESDRETQELEILGDIANMAVDNSDSDSDFDSAVQATVEGRQSAPASRHSSFATKTPRSNAQTEPPEAVIYEVVLEKQEGSLGITLADEDGGKGEGNVFIKSLTPGGPADKGNILQPGDRLLEVNDQAVGGRTCAEAGQMLESAPGLCLLKVARTKSLEAAALHADRAVGGKNVPLALQLPKLAAADSLSEVDSVAAREPPLTPPSAFASAAPTPVQDPPIVPPPPPLNLDLVEDARSNNTQSDVDSDVLDSSRSELERIYVSNEQYLNSDGGDYVDDDDFDAAVAAASAYSGVDLSGIYAEYRAGGRDGRTNSSGDAGKTASKRDPRSGDSGTPEIKFRLGSDDDDNGGDVSPAETLKNESPVSNGSTDSVVQSTVDDNKSRKRSLVRQPRVSEAAEDVNTAAEFEEFIVDLEKAPGGGLGFTVAGGAETTGGCYVKAVVQDPALSDGRLRTGDRLIQVNGHDMTGLSHFEAVTFLRQTPQKVSMRVRRYASVKLPAHKPPHGGQKSGPPDASNKFSGASTHSERHSQKLTPHRQSGERSSESVDGRKQRTERVAEEGTEGRRSVQDIIRSLDTPKAIIKPYEYGRQRSQPEEMTEKEADVKEETKQENEDRLENEAGVKRIVLKKKDQSDSLGFSLVQHKVDGQTGIFIKTLSPGGIAHADGQLRIGDRLLQVNGTSLIGQSHAKAIRILREARGSVVLTVSRTSEQQLEFDTQDNTSLKQTGSELDDRHPPPADTASSNTTNSDTDDDINNILDEAMNYLEKEEDSRGETPVSGNSKSTTPQPRPRSRGPPKPARLKARKMNSKDRKGSDDSQSSSDVSRLKAGVVESFWENTSNVKFARQMSGVSVPEDLTAEWLSSLPLLALGKDAEEMSTQLLQSLADAVEQEEPMVEFKNLRQVRATDNSEVAKLPENKSRNRYRNVLPYDFNRVRLNDITDGNDYVNASHVRLTTAGGQEQLLYIACQGPLASTVGHFWQMVWETGANIVTMVTQEVESGKAKCHIYWPQSEEQPLELCDRKYSVELLKAETVDDFDIRRFNLCEKGSGEKREIVHLHYTTWPDHGVPDTALPLLRFLRLMHLLHRSGPMIVHCSAGIGRSGVLMAVDTALAHMETGDKLDLFDIVSELRRQRYGMIQTQEQYLFCYTACMEALLSMES